MCIRDRPADHRDGAHPAPSHPARQAAATASSSQPGPAVLSTAAVSASESCVKGGDHLHVAVAVKVHDHDDVNDDVNANQGPGTDKSIDARGRGAPRARRDEGAYRSSVTEEQHGTGPKASGKMFKVF